MQCSIRHCLIKIRFRNGIRENSFSTESAKIIDVKLLGTPETILWVAIVEIQATKERVNESASISR